MTARRIKNRPAYFRTAYFINVLKEISGLGPVTLERRIRINQYEKKELFAPSSETVRDYFKLHLPVAFETPKKAKSLPWLLAAELEYPGVSSVFFHPFFDLMYGPVISSAYWNMKIKQIPKEWIESERQRGNTEIAAEWEQENMAAEKRKHRKLKPTQCDPLTFIHTTLMRLPPEIRNILFERRGLSYGWNRKYSPIDSEITELTQYENLDSLAALLGLAKEGAEIGDSSRLNLARNTIQNHASILMDKPEFKKIGKELSSDLMHECNNLDSRRYSQMNALQLGLPAGWQSFLQRLHYEHEKKKLLSRRTNKKQK